MMKAERNSATQGLAGNDRQGAGADRRRRLGGDAAGSAGRPGARARCRLMRLSPRRRVKAAFTAVEERVVRELILDGKRPDGRGPKDLRSIKCEVGLLPRAHGSAVFPARARRRRW